MLYQDLPEKLEKAFEDYFRKIDLEKIECNRSLFSEKQCNLMTKTPSRYKDFLHDGTPTFTTHAPNQFHEMYTL